MMSGLGPGLEACAPTFVSAPQEARVGNVLRVMARDLSQLQRARVCLQMEIETDVRL
jgi:hypothetical protein